MQASFFSTFPPKTFIRALSETREAFFGAWPRFQGFRGSHISPSLIKDALMISELDLQLACITLHLNLIEPQTKKKLNFSESFGQKFSFDSIKRNEGNQLFFLHEKKFFIGCKKSWTRSFLQLFFILRINFFLLSW